MLLFSGSGFHNRFSWHTLRITYLLGMERRFKIQDVTENTVEILDSRRNKTENTSKLQFVTPWKLVKYKTVFGDWKQKTQGFSGNLWNALMCISSIFSHFNESVCLLLTPYFYILVKSPQIFLKMQRKGLYFSKWVILVWTRHNTGNRRDSSEYEWEKLLCEGIHIIDQIIHYIENMDHTPAP